MANIKGRKKNSPEVVAVSRKDLPSLILRQQRALNELHKFFAGNSPYKSMYQLLKACGYSHEIAAHPKQYMETDGIKAHLRPVVEQMERVRDEAINQITVEKLRATSAKDLAQIADVMQKNSNLARGDATSREDKRVLNLPASLIEKHKIDYDIPEEEPIGEG